MMDKIVHARPDQLPRHPHTPKREDCRSVGGVMVTVKCCARMEYHSLLFFLGKGRWPNIVNVSFFIFSFFNKETKSSTVASVCKGTSLMPRMISCFKNIVLKFVEYALPVLFTFRILMPQALSILPSLNPNDSPCFTVTDILNPSP